MRLKMLVVSLMAVAVLILFVASALTVFALVGSNIAEIEQAVAPALPEPVNQPQVIESVLYSERSGHGCPFEQAKMLQVQAEPAEEISDELLSQVGP